MMENVEELGIKTNTSNSLKQRYQLKGKDQKMDHQREAERGLTD